jgi:hypothetical protein
VTDSRRYFFRLLAYGLYFFHVEYDMPNGFAISRKYGVNQCRYVIVRKMNLPVLWIRIWSDPDPVRGSDADPKPDRTFFDL